MALVPWPQRDGFAKLDAEAVDIWQESGSYLKAYSVASQAKFGRLP